jgi:hypothetical protein
LNPSNVRMAMCRVILLLNHDHPFPATVNGALQCA